MQRLQIDSLWIQLFVANSLIILALKIWSFQQVLVAVAAIADYVQARRDEANASLIERTHQRTVQIKQLGPVRGKCLSRSLATYGVLRRYGVHSTIHIGVRKEIDKLAAHAWVEVDGLPVNDSTTVKHIHAVFGRSFGN